MEPPANSRVFGTVFTAIQAKWSDRLDRCDWNSHQEYAGLYPEKLTNSRKSVFLHLNRRRRELIWKVQQEADKGNGAATDRGGEVGFRVRRSQHRRLQRRPKLRLHDVERCSDKEQ